MIVVDYPIIIYPADLDEWDFKDMETYGAAGAAVQVSEGKIVEVTFLDIPRFTELTEASENLGVPCYYRENLIIVTKITKEKIAETVKYLFESRYFDHR